MRSREVRWLVVLIGALAAVFVLQRVTRAADIGIEGEATVEELRAHLGQIMTARGIGSADATGKVRPIERSPSPDLRLRACATPSQ